MFYMNLRGCHMAASEKHEFIRIIVDIAAEPPLVAP